MNDGLPIDMHRLANALDERFLEGRATKKHVLIDFQNERGKARMSVLVFVPNRAEQPVPCFMQ